MADEQRKDVVSVVEALDLERGGVAVSILDRNVKIADGATPAHFDVCLNVVNDWLSVSTRYFYLNNDSNAAVYDYDRHVVGAYVTVSF